MLKGQKTHVRYYSVQFSLCKTGRKVIEGYSDLHIRFPDIFFLYIWISKPRCELRWELIVSGGDGFGESTVASSLRIRLILKKTE